MRFLKLKSLIEAGLLSVDNSTVELVSSVQISFR